MPLRNRLKKQNTEIQQRLDPRDASGSLVDPSTAHQKWSQWKGGCLTPKGLNYEFVEISHCDVWLK